MELIGCVYIKNKSYPLYVDDINTRYIKINNKYERFNKETCWAYKIGNIVIKGGLFDGDN